MHLGFVVLLMAGGVLAHYRGFDARNLIDREERDNDIDRDDEVECPVCDNGDGWLASNEVCPIIRDGKAYKRCKYGVYINSVCNRRDCYRGPEEKCTEKKTEDSYDQRCARGYYCNPAKGVCTGTKYSVDSNVLWVIKPNYRYPQSDHRHVPDLSYPIRAN